MGPWAQAAEAWLNVSIPIAPQKGEIVRLALPGPALTHDVLSADVSLFSRPEGQVWCGATEEWCGFDTAPSVAARTFVLSKATALMPAIAGASLVQQTACLRPVAPDHLPIIGKAPGWDNVYLATGGAHKGILLSPAMGKAIADLITAGTTTLAIAPCAPERFPTASGAVVSD
jgi:glycine/D-amino acid oxidase-like deaminating enzyme